MLNYAKIHQTYAKDTPNICQRYTKDMPNTRQRYANIPTFQQCKFVDEFLIFPKNKTP